MRKKRFVLGWVILFFAFGCSSQDIKLKEQTLYANPQKEKNQNKQIIEQTKAATYEVVQEKADSKKNILPYIAKKFNLRTYYFQNKSTIKTPKHILVNIPRTGNMKFLTDPILVGYTAAHSGNQLPNNRINIVDSQNDNNIISDNNKKLININKQKEQSFLYTPLKNEKENEKEIEYDLNIGPITKSRIKHLINEGTLITPTVALNYSYFGSNIPITNLYEFAISHEDEAYYLAQLLLENNYNKVLIIGNETHWSQRVSGSFIKAFNDVYGVYLYSEYSNNADIKSISNTVSKALNVNNQSVQKYKELLKQFQKDHKKKTGEFIAIEKLELTDEEKEQLKEISNKNNIDAVFALGNNKQIGSIRTFLSYFLANNIPLFTTSLVNTENIEPFYAKALNGVYFIDLPIFRSSSQLKQIQTEFSNQTGKNASYTELRLFAMGNDLFYFSQIIDTYWQHYHKNSFIGYTGELYLKNNQIHRIPSLFQYDNKNQFKEIQLERNLEKQDEI